MSNELHPEHNRESLNDFVTADPKRPYKLYASMASAFIGSLLLGDLGLPKIVVALMIAVVAALSVYVVPNPIIRKPPSRND